MIVRLYIFDPGLFRGQFRNAQASWRGRGAAGEAEIECRKRED